MQSHVLAVYGNDACKLSCTAIVKRLAKRERLRQWSVQTLDAQECQCNLAIIYYSDPGEKDAHVGCPIVTNRTSVHFERRSPYAYGQRVRVRILPQQLNTSCLAMQKEDCQVIV